MRAKLKTCIPLVLCALSLQALHAQGSTAAFTCQQAQGAGLSTSIVLYEIFYDRDALSGFTFGDAFIATDISALPALAAADAGKVVYTSCTLTPGSGDPIVFGAATVGALSVAGVSGGVAAPSAQATAPLLYSLFSLTFNTLSSGGTTVTLPALPAGVTHPAGDPTQWRARLDKFGSLLQGRALPLAAANQKVAPSGTEAHQ